MYYKSLTFSVLFLLLAVTTYGQEHRHSDHLSSLLNHYLAVKDALTEDDFETARSHIADLKAEVLENNEMNNHEEHNAMHNDHHNTMVEAVTEAEKAADIVELRMSFNDITVNLGKALENQGYDDKTLFLQYCPMANNSDGAHWISDREKIVNPYMGQQMPSCGKTEKEISPDN